jgi:hypothetical protein
VCGCMRGVLVLLIAKYIHFKPGAVNVPIASSSTKVRQQTSTASIQAAPTTADTTEPKVDGRIHAQHEHHASANGHRKPHVQGSLAPALPTFQALVGTVRLGCLQC